MANRKKAREHYPTVKCTNPACGYEWEPNVPHPKQCPVCKRYLDWVKVKCLRQQAAQADQFPRPFG